MELFFRYERLPCWEAGPDGVVTFRLWTHSRNFWTHRDKAALLCRGDATGSGGKGGSRSDKSGHRAEQPESHSLYNGADVKTLGNRIIIPGVTSDSLQHCVDKTHNKKYERLHCKQPAVVTTAEQQSCPPQQSNINIRTACHTKQIYMSYTVTTRTDGVNDICVCWCVLWRS